jgi:cytochrome c oxidase subunit 4
MRVHVSPVRVYVLVFLALMIGTATTVWAAFLDLGPLNNVVMLGIAVVKATLVVLYFMHVRYSARMAAVTVLTGVFFLLILFGLLLSDYATRGWLGVPGK